MMEVMTDYSAHLANNSSLDAGAHLGSVLRSLLSKHRSRETSCTSVAPVTCSVKRLSRVEVVQRTLHGSFMDGEISSEVDFFQSYQS